MHISTAIHLVFLIYWHKITENIIFSITLIQKASGVYDFWNYEQKQLKMHWSKKLLILDLFLTKCVRIISCKIFVSQKCYYRWFFNQKVKASICLWWYFLCILAGWESYMTHRWPTGMRHGGRGSHRETSLLPIGRLGVIYDSESHGYALFCSHPEWG